MVERALSMGEVEGSISHAKPSFSMFVLSFWVSLSRECSSSWTSANQAAHSSCHVLSFWVSLSR